MVVERVGGGTGGGGGSRTEAPDYADTGWAAWLVEDGVDAWDGPYGGPVVPKPVVIPH